jgi:lipopolysaccharide export system protein LptA
VEQDGSLVRGERIDYLIPQQLVRADAAGGEGEGRVQVVIPPRMLEDEESGAQDSGEVRGGTESD